MDQSISDTKLSPASYREDRLSSWKEVAAYLGVSVRTVQRWEKREDLPVKRHLHESRATVYALKSELDAWMAKRYSTIEYYSDVLQAEQMLPAAGVDIESKSSGTSFTPSIAILPFINFSDLKEDEYLSDSLVEELIYTLSRIPGLRVTARTSSSAFRGKSVDIREIGAKLNVRTILEGSLAKKGNRIRISVHLIDVANGFHLWSGFYDRVMTDIFSIQDDMCRMIADNLRVNLTADCRSRVNRHSEDTDAYTLFLQGRSHQNLLDPEGVEKSMEYFEQALILDPNYALAYVGIGMSHWIKGFLSQTEPREVFRLCESALKKAFELDNSIAEAHALQGCIHVMRDFDWKSAKASFQLALEIDPESHNSRDLYDFFFLLPRGNLDTPSENAERDLSRNPLSAWMHFRLAYRYFIKRDFERAETNIRKSLEFDSNFYPPYWLMANILLQKGKYDEAARVSEKHFAYSIRGPWALGFMGYTFAKVGRSNETRKILEKLQVISKSRYLPASSFAPVYFGLGQNDRGFECLFKAHEERDFTLIHIAVDPFWDFIRTDPRFDALLQKMKL